MLGVTTCPNQFPQSRDSIDKSRVSAYEAGFAEKNLNFRKYSIIIVSLIFIPSSFAQINIPGDNVSGTWTKPNSPYHINGEITIPNDSTLTIEPGAEVVFMGHYKLNVQGRLLAVGTEQDTITFRAANSDTGWWGIRFKSTASTNDSSKIVYCSLRNGKANGEYDLDKCGGAIMISRFSKVLVSNCLIDSNVQSGAVGPGIYIEYASPIITNCTFSNNSGTDGAITCYYSPNAIISNNVFSNNRGKYGPIICGWYSRPIISGNIITNNVATTAGGGIFVYVSNALIINNVIIHNQAGEGGGIKCYVDAHPTCINNTITYNNGINGGGIAFDGNCNAILINNILFNNSGLYGNQVCILDAQSDPAFLFCDIQEGMDGFKGIGSGASYTGLYDNNIDSDPLFVNITLDNYRLSNSSPCIGTGIDSIEIAGAWYPAPPFCIYKNPRPSPVGSKPDIGACENLLGSPVVGVEQEPTNPTEFLLHQNYPNPFNPTTSIGFRIVNRGFVSLKVYDVLGNEVATLVNEEKPAGTYGVAWNARNLSSGVYFYKLQAGSYVETKKMLMVK